MTCPKEYLKMTWLATVGTRWFLLSMIVIAAHAPAQSQIDPAMRKDDTRLELPVSITRRNTRIGEVVELLSQQTGVPINVHSQDTMSGTPITIHCSKVPLIDVMNALWSITSNKEGRMLWIRSTGEAGYRYEFAESAHVKNRAMQRRAFATQALINHALVMIELAKMTPEQREGNKRRITESLFMDDDYWADALVAYEGTWDNVRLLDAAMPRQTLIKLMRGEIAPTIEIETLAPSAQPLAKRILTSGKTMTRHNDGPWEEVPPPTSLQFYTAPGAEDVLQMSPAVFLRFAMGAKSLVGGYALDSGIRTVIRKAWMMPGDSPESSLSNKIVGPEIQEKTPQVGDPVEVRGRLVARRPPKAIELRLIQTAQGAGISMIAILPRKQDTDPGDPVNRPVQDILEKTGKSSLRPIYKARDGFLMVCYPSWFLEDDKAIPYSLVKKHLRGKDGLIPLVNMASLMSAITDAQAKELALDYPAIEAAMELRPLFRLYSKFPQIITSAGLQLNPRIMEQIMAVPKLAAKPGLVDGTATALRLVQINVEADGLHSIAIRPEVLIAGKGWVSLGGFIQIPKKATGDSASAN
jgi:hypothetical protein